MSTHPTVAELGEDATIEAIARTLEAQRTPVGWVGIGDDAAVTELGPGTKALTTTDLLVEGVHFRLETTSARDLGWKAMAVNASDIAGMGGVPRWATVSLALPATLPASWVTEFYEGALALGSRFDLAIVGGDTVRSMRDLVIAVTVVGEAASPVLRHGARPGDVVLVTGEVGAAGAGFWVLEHPELADMLSEHDRSAVLQAHRRPVPHVYEGLAIASMGARVAMMDNSDGLARSVLWLARTNGVGIVLEAQALPIAPATRRVAEAAGCDPLTFGLYGGEDYNLVATCPEAAAPALLAALNARAGGAAIVGRCQSEGPGAWLRRDGALTALSEKSAYQAFGA